MVHPDPDPEFSRHQTHSYAWMNVGGGFCAACVALYVPFSLSDAGHSFVCQHQTEPLTRLRLCAHVNALKQCVPCIIVCLASMCACINLCIASLCALHQCVPVSMCALHHCVPCIIVCLASMCACVNVRLASMCALHHCVPCINVCLYQCVPVSMCALHQCVPCINVCLHQCVPCINVCLVSMCAHWTTNKSAPVRACVKCISEVHITYRSFSRLTILAATL